MWEMVASTRRYWSGLISVLLVMTMIGSVGAQAIFPRAMSDYRVVPGSAASHPLEMPGSDYRVSSGNTLCLSSGMLRGLVPLIPNLEIGYLYSFGNNVSNGRLTIDYLLPLSIGSGFVVFGEAHGEFQDFWKKPPGGTSNRVDISLGGGGRKIIGESLLVGPNTFYDSSRLYNDWYSSGGFGLEMAAVMPGDDLIDLNFNYYGSLFGRSGFLNGMS